MTVSSGGLSARDVGEVGAWPGLEPSAHRVGARGAKPFARAAVPWVVAGQEQVAEFSVEVVVRSGDQLLFSGETPLEIVSPTFGRPLVRMDEFEDGELLALFGISEEEAAPSGDQNHDAFLDVFAKDGEISHVRLEVGNDSTTTGNTTPLLEVLFQQ